MNSGLISKRYAKALLGFATDNQAEDQIHQQMKLIVKAFNDFPQLIKTLENPLLGIEKKRQLLLSLVEVPSPVYSRFVDFLLHKRREDYLRSIALAYEELYCSTKNIIKGKLITAVPPTDEMIAKITQIFHKVKAGTLELETEENPAIKGGFVLLFDTYRLDASIRAQLKFIKNQLQIENAKV